MANETITVVGNLTADPELRFTRSSASTAPFCGARTSASARLTGPAAWRVGLPALGGSW
jgi:single-stranded DNA-binding protein